MEADPNADETLRFKALIRTYYDKCFPFDKLHQMITRNNNATAQGHREIAFYWTGPSRWHVPGETAEKWRAEVFDAQPLRIEAGAVYTLPVEERAYVGRTALVPCGRELVIDIDIDETMNELRACDCDGAFFCKFCWPIVNAWALVADSLLADLYDFKHRLWVYSGRRGLHCWVLDERAFDMSDAARFTLVNVFEQIKQDLPSRAVQSTRRVLSRHVDLCTRVKNLFSEHAERCPTLFMVDRVRATTIAVAAAQVAKSNDDNGATQTMSPTELAASGMWLPTAKDLPTMCMAHEAWSSFLVAIAKKSGEYVARCVEIAVAAHFFFPRIDKSVTQRMGHLLKLPFCVHPKTSSVCIPLCYSANADSAERVFGGKDAFFPGPATVPDAHVLCHPESHSSKIVETHTHNFNASLSVMAEALHFAFSE